jgi:hypothetical protein
MHNPILKLKSILLNMSNYSFILERPICIPTIAQLFYVLIKIADPSCPGLYFSLLYSNIEEFRIILDLSLNLFYIYDLLIRFRSIRSKDL